MATKFPRAVVVDPDKHHHYVVWVHRGSSEVMTACVDCADVVMLSLSQLDQLRSLVRNDDDAQIIAWVEDDE